MNRSIPLGAFTAVLSLWLTAGAFAGEVKRTADKPIAARVATIESPSGTAKFVAESLAKQTGLEVDVSEIDVKRPLRVAFDKAEFWRVVDGLADLTGSRVLIGHMGKPVRLVPRANGQKAIVSVDGPFRISAREMEARRDLLNGSSFHDLTLEIAWEARLPVCRMDAAPTIVKGEDDAGRPITVKPVATRIAVDGISALIKVRLEGVTRDSRQIALLSGNLRITAAEEMLRFTFDDLGKFPIAMKRNGVGVAVTRVAKDGTYWIADVDLTYPADGPIFESFESNWLSRNRIVLVSPTGARFTPIDEEINGPAIRYRFKESDDFKPNGNLKGWKLEYESIGAMREAPVRFELKGIALP